MISADTTMAELLDAHPGLVDVIADFHPHVAWFRDRARLGMMGRRITVAQAAGMAGVPARELLAALRRSLGQPETDVEVEAGSAPRPSGGPPPALAGLRPVHLDVREDIRQGIEPFARIMAAVKKLGADEALALRAPFEPLPLYAVLGRRGLAHWSEHRGADDWVVWFYQEPAPAGATERAAVGPASPTPATIIVDVRGLEPPQPMVRVLERLDGLGPGQELLVVHDRRPMFLYPLLEERGFVHESREAGPGRVEILIRRARESAGDRK